jgi:hypothetical protein
MIRFETLQRFESEQGATSGAPPRVVGSRLRGVGARREQRQLARAETDGGRPELWHRGLLLLKLHAEACVDS